MCYPDVTPLTEKWGELVVSKMMLDIWYRSDRDWRVNGKHSTGEPNTLQKVIL